MLRIFTVVFLLMSFAHAEVGEITSLRGGTDSYLMRSGNKSVIAEGDKLEVGDSIHSATSYVTLVLYPKIQMGLAKDTELKITSHMVDEANGPEKTDSLIELIKGLVRIQVTRDHNEEVKQRVDARGVSFAVRGTEYEVYSTDEDAELDVFEGEVEVTSPHVQTFVPEIVKPNEGFRYARKARQFSRRAFKQRNKEANFLKKEEMRSKWQQNKALRKQKKLERKTTRDERKETKLEGIKARRAERKEKRNRGR
jgi:hypothetical protein